MSIHHVKIDALDKLWASLEAKLKGHNILDPINFIVPETKEQLTFGKYDKSWRICYASSSDSEWRPITDCPVAVRVKMSAYAREFADTILNHTKNHIIPKIDEALAKMNELLS